MIDESVAFTLRLTFGDFAAGIACGLLLSALLRIRAVAVTVAAVLALLLLGAIFVWPGGPAALGQAALDRVAQHLASGFWLGLALSHTSVTLVQGLTKTSSKKGRRR